MGPESKMPKDQKWKRGQWGSTDPWRQGRRPGMKVRPQLRLSGASAQWFKEKDTHTVV